MTRLLLVRSSRVWGHAALASAICAFMLVSRGSPWRGEWLWTLDWVAGVSILLGPVLAGVTAYEVATFRAFDLGLARPSARRRVLATLVPVLGPLAATVGPFVVAITIAVGLSWSLHPTDGFTPILPILALLCLMVFAAAGALLGQRLPPTPAALVAWAVGLMANTVLAGAGVPALLRVGGISGSLAGLTLDASAAAERAVFYSSLTGLAVMLSVPFAGGRLRLLVAGGLGVVALASGLVLASDGYLYRPDPEADVRCDVAGGATVCMLEGNTGQLPQWTRGLATMRARLDLPWLPPRDYRQLRPGALPTQGVGVLAVNTDRVNVDPPALADLALSLARPSDCPQFAGDTPPTQALTAQHYLAEWFRAQEHHAGPGSDPEVTDWIRRTGRADQERWAQAAYEALAGCDLDAARPPDP